MYILYMQILKVVTKVKQNMKLEKELKMVEKVRKIPFMTARLDFFLCAHLFTHKDHTD